MSTRESGAVNRLHCERAENGSGGDGGWEAVRKRDTDKMGKNCLTLLPLEKD